MKLHVKHLKSNKKSIFSLSIILLIPFSKKKKKWEKKEKRKNGEKFPSYKEVCFSHQHPMSSSFLISAHCPNPTQVPLPVNMKIAIIRQGWGSWHIQGEGREYW